ncbi:dihydrofolate reductase family protein [Nocardia puris]|uniref:Dihydrofolate reductase n=1 Tax=Nocardia puris TaxID=208602 RepID=A0A366D627_9NOCA|nr:dihydrofolate reductase family protein [Nocardia puris]MBF6212257.1 dihydrofolate reductase family protein [Nocardia puris]MBF6366504.1 dihydrofolate reductase family protein [Nocardia puris]MBF6460846.1 dihydrofolate reductase family protein [Nocardia puris]RBO85492.1 dihydrofolate reductase [Nocardia puris]
MGQVISNLSMSLDGFIEDADGSVDRLFEWYTAGPVETDSANERISYRQSEEDVESFQEIVGRIGALIAGRRLFDVASGWNGMHPTGVPVVVVTHHPPTADEFPYPEAPFTFVTDGVANAIERAKELAGDKDVVIASPDIARQALDAELLDVITVDLVPYLLGSGTPYFANLAEKQIRLDNPVVRPGNRVTHLSYRVLY